MPPVTVIFYARENGQEPAKDFILGLDIKMRAKVLRTIKLLADNGTDLREPSSKSLGSGIFELRIKFGSDITRILYFFFIGQKAILTNGFVKKTQKTPVGEVEKAQAYRKDYITRMGKNNDAI